MQDKYLKRWLLKIKYSNKVVQCDKCNRLAISDPDRFSLEYCRKMKIPFTCSSCKFPQYADTLCCSTRGNVGKIYGKKFVPRLNKWIEI